MSNVVIVGVQWGDEGKGKFVDLLAQEIDYVVRFSGRKTTRGIPSSWTARKSRSILFPRAFYTKAKLA